MSRSANKEFIDPEIRMIFDNYPHEIREKLLLLRQLIFDVAEKTQGVLELEETLKWGQPSYVTTLSKSGSTIRIDQVKSKQGGFAMYFNCKTFLVDVFKEKYGNKFTFEGNRSILFNPNDPIPIQELSDCIGMELTYHAKKKANHRRQ